MARFAGLSAHVSLWVLPDTAAFRTLRKEIQQGLAWPKMMANTRVEPRDAPLLSNEDPEILKHLVQRHGLNASQAVVVRQVLDESCIIVLIGGAGTRKSDTLVACIKAVLWQQGLLFAQNLDRAPWHHQYGQEAGGS